MIVLLSSKAAFLFLRQNIMLRKKDKEKIVEALTEKIKDAKSIIFADYRGMTANQVRSLRKEMIAKEVEYGVYKKTLVRIALKNIDIEADMGAYKGPIALAFSKNDEVVPAKVLAAFGKGKETLKIVGGVLQKQVLDQPAAIRLSRLPDKQELIGKVVGTMAAPLSSFVGVLSANIRQLAYVLNAVKEAKEAK